MSLFDQYETSPTKEIDGVPVQFAPNDDGTVPTFIIAATSKTNARYAKALDSATKPWRRNMDAIGNEKAESLYRDVFIKTVLKGWSNVQDRDGKDIPYSQQAAIDLFKRLPRLYDAIVDQAGSIEIFKEEAREGEAKN